MQVRGGARWKRSSRSICSGGAGNDGVLLWLYARKKNSRFDGGIVAAAVADALAGRTRGGGVVVL